MAYNKALDHDLDGVNGGDVRALEKRRDVRGKLEARKAELERKLRARDGAKGFERNVVDIRSKLTTLNLMIAMCGEVS